MPIYDYDCASCGRRSEIIHGVHADPPTECPICGGGPLRKAVTASAVHFKGSGWAKKERRAAPAKAGTSSGSTGDGSTGDGASGGESSSADHKDGAASVSESTSGSKGAKTGGDAGASTATKPAAD
jgi:putative FmdB family regulatory protein